MAPKVGEEVESKAMDFMTTAQRSRAMSAVGSKDTGIEKALRSHLHQRGFRFRKNVRELAGHPDIVLPKYHCVIFVHGCFWHHHANCKRSKLPETRRAFWSKKIGDNVKRDLQQIRLLRKDGWKVIVMWECVLKNPNKAAYAIAKLVNTLTNAV
jgi:DNA mismatch endonuclease (patch repair protein)